MHGPVENVGIDDPQLDLKTRLAHLITEATRQKALQTPDAAATTSNSQSTFDGIETTFLANYAFDAESWLTPSTMARKGSSLAESF